MPRRTNDFQRLIARIHAELAPTGARVTESALVKDSDTGQLREVDVLIEQVVGGRPHRIVVECRDRSRKESVAWIEELIGKRQAIEADRVVAVSMAGFTGTAEIKAKRRGIDVYMLIDAEKVDWAAQLPRHDLVVSSAINYRLYSVPLFDQSGHLIAPVGEGAEIRIHGVAVGRFKSYLYDYFVRHIRPHMHRAIITNLGAILRHKADLDKEVLVEQDHVIDGLGIVWGSDTIEVKNVRFIVFARFLNSRTIDQENRVYGDVLVSTACVSMGEGRRGEVMTLRNTEGDLISFSVVERAKQRVQYP